MLVYDKKYIKAKVRELNGAIKQTFWVIKYQKKACITFAIVFITIDSAMKIGKKNYPQVYLEE